MKKYKKVLLIVVLIIAAFVGGFFIFSREKSRETNTKGESDFNIKSDKSKGVKLYLIDASRDNREVHTNFDVEFGNRVKGIDYDSASLGEISIEEPGIIKSKLIGSSAGWSTEENKELNKIKIEHSGEIDDKIGNKLRLSVEDILLKKSKKSTHKLDFHEESVEIQVNGNIVEKIVLKKPKVYDDELVVEAEIYNKDDRRGVWMRIFDGDEEVYSSGCEGRTREKNIQIKKTIFNIENHDISNLVLEINYEELVKEIKGKWSVDFEVDYDNGEDSPVVKEIYKQIDLGDYSFLIDKAEKTSKEINVYTSDLKSSLQDKHMVDWDFHNVDFIYGEGKYRQGAWNDIDFSNHDKKEVLKIDLFDHESEEIGLDDLKINIESIQKNYKLCEDYSECNLINLKNIGKEEKIIKSELKGKPVEIKYKRVGENIELELISDKDKLGINSIQLLNKEGKPLEDDKVKTTKYSSLRLKNRYVQHITLEKTELEEINFVIDNYSEIVKVNKEIDLD